MSVAQPTTPRRIRFAPLLDPRHLVVVTDDGHELPIKDDTHFPAATSLAVLHPPSQQPPVEPSLSTTPTKSHTNILKPFKRSSLIPSTTTITIHPKPKPKSRPLSITTEDILTLGTIKLFRTSSISSNTRKPSDAASDSSTTPTTPTHSFPGWAAPSSSLSAPSSESATDEALKPLDRISKHKHKSSMSSIFSSVGVSFPEVRYPGRAKCSPSFPSSTNAVSAKPRATSAGTATAKQMLNGRIYGAKSKSNHRSRSYSNNNNPFSNAVDEPEFVEWGYGGMGSAKGARSAGVVVGAGGGRGSGAVNWERLVGSSSASSAPSVNAGKKKRKDEEGETREPDQDADDDDDGSGIAWVRKRRRQREAAAAAAAASASSSNKEAAHAVNNGSSRPTSSSNKEAAHVANNVPPRPTSSSNKEAAHVANNVPPRPTSSSNKEVAHVANNVPPRPTSSSGSGPHVLKAVPMPMPTPSHGHGPGHHQKKHSLGGEVPSPDPNGLKRGASVVRAHGSTGVEKPTTPSLPSPVASSPSGLGSSGEEGDRKGKNKALAVAAGPLNSSNSSSSDGAESGSGEEDDNDEDDEEEEEEEEKEERKTAIGAGVEKVSRHRE